MAGSGHSCCMREDSASELSTIANTNKEIGNAKTPKSAPCHWRNPSSGEISTCTFP